MDSPYTDLVISRINRDLEGMKQEIEALRTALETAEPFGKCTAHPRGERCHLTRGHSGMCKWASGD